MLLDQCEYLFLTVLYLKNEGLFGKPSPRQGSLSTNQWESGHKEDSQPQPIFCLLFPEYGSKGSKSVTNTQGVL